MPNPNSLKNLKPFKAGEERTRICGKKGGETKAERYKSLREVFRQELTEDEAKQIRGMLLELIAAGNLNALDRFVNILGDSASTQVNVEAQVGCGVVMMEQQTDGDK